MIFHGFILLIPLVLANQADYVKVTRKINRVERRLRTIEDNIAEERIQRREDVQSILGELLELKNTIQENYGNKKDEMSKFGAEKRARTVMGQITRAFTNEKQGNLRFRREIQENLRKLSSDISRKLKVQLEDNEKMSIKLMNEFNEIQLHIAATKGTCQRTDAKLERFRRLGVTTLTTNLNTPRDAECLANLVDKSKTSFSSCVELKYAGFTKSGIYKLKVKNRQLQVYCDQTTDGGGWIVFQRRNGGSVDFYRTWKEYKHGFGDLEGEFWLGNDDLAVLTENCCHELRVDLGDVDGNTRYATYNEFRVLDEASLYELNIGAYNGNAGDSLKYLNKMKFSTKDSENDISEKVNCAAGWEGAWWFEKCYRVHLNGVYWVKGFLEGNHGRISWTGWKNKRHDGNYHSLTFTEMKFR